MKRVLKLTITTAAMTAALAAWNVARAQSDADFYFAGGSVNEFVKSIDQHYKVDWVSVADISRDLQTAHIPALRIAHESVEDILTDQTGPRGGILGGGGGGVGGRRGGPMQVETNGQIYVPGAKTEKERELAALVKVYNRLSARRPELGQLYVQGDYGNPALVMFSFNSIESRAVLPAPQREINVKAFPLKQIPENQWDKLSETVNEELTQLNLAESRNAGTRAFGGGGTGGFGGGMGVFGGGRGGSANAGSDRNPATVSLHKDTALLVVMGPSEYVEAAQSIVEAEIKNQGK